MRGTERLSSEIKKKVDVYRCLLLYGGFQYPLSCSTVRYLRRFYWFIGRLPVGAFMEGNLMCEIF